MRAAVLGDESQDHQSDGVIPEVCRGKQRGVTRQTTLEMMADLTLQLGAFGDQIASMPRGSCGD
ncbi:MAG: hypothetical protein U0941_21660 [Planctomycetaceae bacterium]